MKLRAWLLASALAAACAWPSSAAAHGSRPRTAVAARDNVPVLSAPHAGARILTRLVQQTELRVLSRGRRWDRVSIWAGTRGWVRAGDVVFGAPRQSVSSYKAPVIHTQIRAHAPTALSARAEALDAVISDRGLRVAGGTALRVTGWKQTSSGSIMYQVGRTWLPGDSIRFAPDRDGARGWSGAAGKGMWVTVGTMADTDPAALVAGARRAGISHLYLEAAISPLGFHGRDEVGPVIEAAHRAHMHVFAWVYPYLVDVASDIVLTERVARYRTADNQRFDGVAADLERNLDLWRLRAYSQIVRADLPHESLIAVTYPPQSLPSFPYGEIARQYDAIAPMDYWHYTKSTAGPLYGGLSYGSAYAYRYALDSVQRIRATGASVPILPIGQTFDDFGRFEIGPYAPSGAEIRGFLRGCRAGGAPGVSFFQWLSASVPEWTAIARTPL